METINETLKTILGLSFWDILITVVIFIVGFSIINALTKWIPRRFKWEGKLDISLSRFINRALQIVLYFILLIICAGRLGIPTTSLVTLLGTLGLAFSLAMQDSLKNVAGGLFILTAKPFGTGDFIETGSISGTVKEIGIIYTTILTDDNRTINVPNGALSGSTVTNYSLEQTRRLELTFTVPYKSDTAMAKRLIAEAVGADARVKAEPEPFIRVWGMTAAAVDIIVRVWCLSSDYAELRSSILESVKLRFDENGII